jgi:hypothetical protein
VSSPTEALAAGKAMDRRPTLASVTATGLWIARIMQAVETARIAKVGRGAHVVVAEASRYGTPSPRVRRLMSGM